MLYSASNSLKTVEFQNQIPAVSGMGHSTKAALLRPTWNLRECTQVPHLALPCASRGVIDD
jgi:hypothetical protein